MLGYVRPLKMELKIREFQRYQSVYCAVCKALGRKFGQTHRLAVSYDATFLALFLLAFEEQEGEERLESCIANPLRKRAVAAPHKMIDFAADVTALLVSERGKDDWRDGQIFRALPEKILFHKAAEKTAGKYPLLAALIKREMTSFRDYEEKTWALAIPPERDEMLEEVKKRANEAAAYNGRMLREILLTGCALSENPDLQDERFLSLMGIIGAALGEWVYLMDAADDREDDLRHGRFNPFRGPERSLFLETASAMLEDRERSLDLHAALLPYVKDAGIVCNLFTMGLPAERERMLKGDKSRRL